jgi:sugar lactone lactonase YvrE
VSASVGYKTILSLYPNVDNVNRTSARRVIIPTGATPGALKLFDLRIGAAKGSVPLPPSTLLKQTALCNDIAVAPDGTVYVTDSFSGHILRMKPGTTALETWAHDARWDVAGPHLDGIAVLADGNVYANVFEGDGLYRIAVNPDGGAGTITKLPDLPASLPL